MTPKIQRRISALLWIFFFVQSSVADAEETVRFNAVDGTPLSGILFKPDGIGPFPGAIMLHGCSGMLTRSGKLKKRETAWARILINAGYVVLLADSFTPRGLVSICRIKDRPVLPHRERPGDAYGALGWLQAQPFVHRDQVALLGWSNGAMTMLWTVRDAPEAKPAGLGADFAAAVGFYPGCVELRRKAANFRPRIPVLIQMGALDNWTLPGPCQALVGEANSRGGAPMEIDLYPGSYHSFDHPDSMVKEVVTKNSQLTGGEKRVMTGSNPEARARAIRRVLDWLRPRLSGSP